MSRPPHNPSTEPVRIEYSEPEQLDRILEHLRRVRDAHEAGISEQRTGGAAQSIAFAELPRPSPGEARDAGEPRNAENTSPPATRFQSPRAAKLDSAAGMRHMPASAVEKLTEFVAGNPEQPAPMPPRPAAKPAQAIQAAPARIVTAPAARPLHAAPKVASRSGELRAALEASRSAFISTGLFSLVINVLMLAGPLFMLQVYDRVMSSGSMSTLLALSLLTAGIYGVIGLLELVRSRVIVRVGIDLDRRIGDRVFQASLQKSLHAPGSSLMALRELDGLRQFIAGPGPLTFFDAPWTPIYLLVVFMLHWTLGIAATLGTVLLVAIAWASEVRSRAPLQEAGKAAGRSIELAETAQRNAEAITAMGMLSAYRARWQLANSESLGWQVLAADRLGTMSSLQKALRLLLQSLMLAIGAALAIKGEISAGSIVAATILFGRALAPVEQGVGQWRSFVKAREAYDKLGDLLRAHPKPPERTSLPRPKGHIDVASVRVAAPESKTVILSGVTFTLEPGRMLAVIGPSASGKSTLARTLVGLWEPFGGQIRLDGARIDQWNPEELGQYIGYLPQDVELFAGTVRDNISRFRPEASDADVVAAAKAAHAHEMIMALPQSYETQLGAFGTYLSAGQRQRIGLARALFGSPALIVLDEPNANLDRSGDEALSAAIDGMRERGQAVVLISHRVQAISKADYLLYLEKGAQRAFGPRAEVIRYLQQGMAQSGSDQPAAATPKQTGQPSAPPKPGNGQPHAAAPSKQGKPEPSAKVDPRPDRRGGKTTEPAK